MDVTATELQDDRKRRVVDRLAVVRGLIALKNPIAKPQHVGIRPDGTGVGEYDQHDSLINYLLLTCFDVLGQQAPFVDFKKWLQSKKLSDERQQALSTLAPNQMALDVTEALFDWYSCRYSVTKGFYRFIDEVITAGAKEALLASVAVVRVPQVEDPDQLVSMKKKFLYDLRNQFTHGAVTPTTVSRMDDGARLEIVDVNEGGHRTRIPFRQALGKIDQEGSYFVADWPFVLYETVAGAVGEPIPEWQSIHTLVVTFPDGSGGTTEGVSRLEFKDRVKRTEILAAAEALVNHSSGSSSVGQ
jgi:hypothetical protein